MDEFLDEKIKFASIHKIKNIFKNKKIMIKWRISKKLNFEWKCHMVLVVREKSQVMWHVWHDTRYKRTYLKGQDGMKDMKGQ